MIDLAPNLKLPLEVVTQAVGLVGQRGSGKTHALMVLVEELVGAGADVPEPGSVERLDRGAVGGMTREQLERADACGTSSMVDRSVEEVIWLNRAGTAETCLSRSQIVDYYVVRCDPKAERPKGVKIDDDFTLDKWRALP